MNLLPSIFNLYMMDCNKMSDIVRFSSLLDLILAPSNDMTAYILAEMCNTRKD